MNLSERNQKVAKSRWNKRFKKEEKNILRNKEGSFLKSVICGFLAGDGSIRIRENTSNYQVDLFADNKSMVKSYCQSIERVYSKKPSIKKRKNMYEVRISSKTIAKDIMKEAQFGLFKWNIPVKLLSNKANKRGWLKAFFSAEAYVSNKTIRVQTVNKQGMGQVSQLLQDLNIEHKNYKYIPKIKKYSPVYIIVISEAPNRSRAPGHLAKQLMQEILGS